MAQQQALASLAEQGQTPLSAMERAQLGDIQRGVSQQEQARQQQILSEMAQRGMGGSGNELAARLISSQKAADLANQQAAQVAAMAQQRALNATSQAGALGGQIRGQEFGEKSAQAQAADTIARFNAGQQQSVQQRNVGALNEAQLRNLQEKQRIADEQNRLRNSQQMYNKELLQKQFQNQVDIGQAMAGGYQQRANQYNSDAASQLAGGANLGSGISGLVGAFGSLGGSKKPTDDGLSALDRIHMNK
jgi:hypothetical protein